MKDDKIRMAQTCSTCRFAAFGEANFHQGGKKQGGLCFLHVDTAHLAKKDVKPPKQKHKEWYHQFHSLMYYRVRPNINEEPNVPTLEEWLAHVDENLEKSAKWRYDSTYIFKKPGDTRESIKAQLVSEVVEYYHSRNEIQEWWERNRPIMRQIHRQTVCDSWEHCTSRESVAKKIVKELDEKSD